MPISKFIPSYHHHFAKQCRVSDYGYSKLLELLEAVPHVLQVDATSVIQYAISNSSSCFSAPNYLLESSSLHLF